MLLRCDQSFPQPIKVYNLDLGDVIPFILTIWKQTACPMAYILAIHAVKPFFAFILENKCGREGFPLVRGGASSILFFNPNFKCIFTL